MNLYKKILTFILPFLAMALFQSCVFENINDDEPTQGPNGEHAMLVLHIMKLDGSGKVVDQTDDINEIVNDFRIIIINENGEIESNDLITSDEFLINGNPNELYYLFKVLEPGKRKFYLFANEGSVDDLEGSVNGSLSSFLAGISVGSKASNFESAINSAWFQPIYQFDDNEIALPYSSFYELDMKAGIRYEQPMYLVPVATKINLNFYNYRDFAVDVKEASISKIADSNFLMGQPALNEQKKFISTTEYYWIDWLARISEMSNEFDSFSPNVDFNQTYGWIKNYSLPTSAVYADKRFTEETGLLVPKVTTGMGQPVPGEGHITTIYLPESRYIVDPKLSQEQEYFLNLVLEDKDTAVMEEIEVSVPLTNVNALFRNTRVIIDVNFNQGTDEIYVEIRSWYSTDNFYGTVSGK